MCVLEDIELEEENLEECRKRNTEYRERLNKVHVRLNEIRDELHKRNISAGLLVAREELMEMEKMMVLKEQLKDKIATIKREIESFEPAKQQLRRLVRSSESLPTSLDSIRLPVFISKRVYPGWRGRWLHDDGIAAVATRISSPG